jgi:hypothetical protein
MEAKKTKEQKRQKKYEAKGVRNGISIRQNPSGLLRSDALGQDD